MTLMHWKEFRSHISYLPEEDLECVERAFELGKKAHEGQKRKSGEPYFTHPIAVAHLLADLGADRDTLIVALLHDTVEDTTITLTDIEVNFGSTVAELIDGVTKLKREDITEKPTLDEKIETLRKIFQLTEKDVRIMVIKLIDRLHNMQTIEFVPEQKRVIIAKETLEVHVKIADRLSMNDLADELEALCLGILEPDLFVRLSQLRQRNEKIGHGTLAEMSKILHKNHKEAFRDVKIEYEHKSWKKLGLQLETKSAIATGLATISTTFICNDVDDCYRVLGALHQTWKRETLSFEDYINSPLLSGYRGLHTIIIMENGIRVRCKIRTKEMDEYAHRGIATRCFKKDSGDDFQPLPWTQRISTLSADTHDHSQGFWENLQSDILGESIIVHGPDDRTATIPRNSTALDAAFYLFGEVALRSNKIIVNGRDTPFQTTLHYADSVTVHLARHNHVNHEWLSWVQSGVATGKIREALSRQSDRQKLQFARQLLEQEMLEHKKGYLAEFDERKLEKFVSQLGYETLHNAYTDIADGKLNVDDLYQAIFAGKKKTDSSLSDYSVHITMPIDSTKKQQAVDMLQETYALQKYSVRENNQGIRIQARLKLNETLSAALAQQLKTIGALHIQLEKMTRRYMRFSLCILLAILWGLDPLFASIILHWGVSPVDFTVLRLSSVFFTAAILFIVTLYRYPFSPLPLRDRWLWIAGITLAAISYLSYEALLHGSPVLYNTVLRGNALLIALTELARRTKRTSFTWAIVLMIAGYTIIGWNQGLSTGFLLSLAVLFVFYLYTLASTRFQQAKKVQARYSQFFLYASGIALATSLLVFFPIAGDIRSLPINIVARVVTYSIVFVGTPYVLFYWLTKNYSYALISPWISFALVFTFVGQSLTEGYPTILPFLPAAVLLVWGNFLASKNLSTGLKPSENSLQ